MATAEPIIQKVRVRLRSYDQKLLDSVTHQIVEVILKLDGKFRGPVPLPTEIRRWTVLRSPFVYKNAREQFEIRVHKRLVDIISPNQKIIQSLSDLSLPAGVEIEIAT